MNGLIMKCTTNMIASEFGVSTDAAALIEEWFDEVYYDSPLDIDEASGMTVLEESLEDIARENNLNACDEDTVLDYLNDKTVVFGMINDNIAVYEQY